MSLRGSREGVAGIWHYCTHISDDHYTLPGVRPPAAARRWHSTAPTSTILDNRGSSAPLARGHSRRAPWSLADGSCCPAISLELRSLTTAVLPQPNTTTTAPHPRQQQPATSPATSLGPAAFCDALSCPPPSPLHRRRSCYARRPSSQHQTRPPRDCRNLPLPIARSANPRPHRTSPRS